MARQRTTGVKRLADTSRFPNEEWAWVTDAFPGYNGEPDPHGYGADRAGLNPFFPFLVTPDTAREVWGRLGVQATESWIAVRPGTRPSLWWCFEAPVPRAPGQSEAAYLKQHDLFAPGEEERVPASAVEPVPPHHQHEGQRDGE